MNEKKTDKRTNKVAICRGGGNTCIYVNDYRVAGGKPWGGGEILHEFKTSTKDLIMALDTSRENKDKILEIINKGK